MTARPKVVVVGGEMRVKDLRPQRVVAVTRGDTLRETARWLVDEDVDALAVFDSTGAVGMLSERDLARAVADGVDLDERACTST